VRVIQMALIHLGFPMPSSTAKFGSPDGIFGQETKDKVKQFQKKHKLSRDGDVGRNTMAKLDELVRSAWVPPPEIDGPGNTRRSDENARIAVLQTLSGSACQNINFHYQGTSISGNDFIRVSEAVFDNVIQVEVGAVPGAMAVYFPARNLLRLAFLLGNTAKRRSAIVHELTHAAVDRRRITIPTLRSEAIAWIAQCLYLRITGVDSLSPGFDSTAQPIYEAANQLASEWRKGHQFSTSSVQALERELGRVSQYSRGDNFIGDGF
jgi:peptidoglycan hydrolase-like protein with peptidoglycan-binding domain